MAGGYAEAIPRRKNRVTHARCVWLALLTLATSRGIQLAPVEQKTDRRLLPRLPRLPPLPQLPLQELQERVQKLQERVRKVLEAQLTVTKP